MPEFVLGTFWKTTITVTDSEISSKGHFSSWKVQRKDIAGYRSSNKYIKLYNEEDRSIASTGPDYNFLCWLEENYPDMDVLMKKRDWAEILADENFGQTEEAREATYRAARWQVYLLTGVAIAIFLAQFFGAGADWAFFCMAYLILILSIVLYRKYKGLVRILTSNGGVYPVLWPFFIAVLASFIPSFAKHNLLGIGSVVSYGVAIATVLVSLMLLAVRSTMRIEKSKYLMGIMVLYFIAIAFVSAAAADCVFDSAPSVEYRVVVKDKTEQRYKRSSSYYLNLPPWGPVPANSTVKVSNRFYNGLAIGDTVLIDLHPGTLGMQWYELTGVRFAAEP